jgi:hypothetical protein
MASMSARADSIWINGAGLRSVTIGQAVSGQAFSTGEAGGSMLMHAGDGASTLSLQLPATIGTPISFRVDYSPTTGYRFSISDPSSSNSLHWGRSWVNSNQLTLDDSGDGVPAGSLGDALSVNSKSTERLAGLSPSSLAFNTLQFSAHVDGESASMQLSDLRFESFGALDVAAGELADQSSLLFSGDGASSFSQSIFSDVNLSGLNWSLSGSLWTSTSGPISIDFEQSQSQFSVIPLPPAAAAGMATLAGIAGVSVLRRRRQA